MTYSPNPLDPAMRFPGAPASQRPLRLLVVDDEAMLRSVISEFLELFGYTHFHVACDGVEALDILRTRPIDCMLSDIRMPRMALDEVLTSLGGDHADLTVIATSGCSDFESVCHIFERGAHDFLAKPLNLEALNIALNWVSERSGVLESAAMCQSVDSPASAQARSGQIEVCLDQSTSPFRSLLTHARRLGRLAQAFDTGIDDEACDDLVIAAYLHECGAGHQMLTLCQSPRRLDPAELKLVQHHSRYSGHLAARAMGRPQLATIIGQQGIWEEMTPAQWAVAGREPRLACWLGLLNAVDGWLNSRPDRPAIGVGQLRDMLQRRVKHSPLEPLRRLLDQWHSVERFYAQPLERATPAPAASPLLDAKLGDSKVGASPIYT